MKNLTIAFSVVLVSCLPALAQNTQTTTELFPSDPHAWYKNQVLHHRAQYGVSGPAAQTIQTQAGENAPQGTVLPYVQDGAPAKTDVKQMLNTSIGSIDKTYRGKHQWFNDGSEMPWVLGGLAALAGFAYLQGRKNKALAKANS